MTTNLTIGVQARGMGKAIIFWANAKFFWQKPAAKNEKIRLFTNSYWVGRVGQNSFE